MIIENENDNIVSFYNNKSDNKLLHLDKIHKVLYIGGNASGVRMLKFQSYKKYFTFFVENELYVIKENEVFKMDPIYNKDGFIATYRLKRVKDKNIKLFEKHNYN